MLLKVIFNIYFLFIYILFVFIFVCDSFCYFLCLLNSLLLFLELGRFNFGRFRIRRVS